MPLGTRAAAVGCFIGRLYPKALDGSGAYSCFGTVFVSSVGENPVRRTGRAGRLPVERPGAARHSSRAVTTRGLPGVRPGVARYSNQAVTTPNSPRWLRPFPCWKPSKPRPDGPRESPPPRAARATSAELVALSAGGDPIRFRIILYPRVGMNILCPRAGGNLVQKRKLLLNDFLLQLSRAVLVPLGTRTGL